MTHSLQTIQNYKDINFVYTSIQNLKPLQLLIKDKRNDSIIAALQISKSHPEIRVTDNFFTFSHPYFNDSHIIISANIDTTQHTLTEAPNWLIPLRSIQPITLQSFNSKFMQSIFEYIFRLKLPEFKSIDDLFYNHFIENNSALNFKINNINNDSNNDSNNDQARAKQKLTSFHQFVLNYFKVKPFLPNSTVNAESTLILKQDCTINIDHPMHIHFLYLCALLGFIKPSDLSDSSDSSQLSGIIKGTLDEDNDNILKHLFSLDKLRKNDYYKILNIYSADEDTEGQKIEQKVELKVEQQFKQFYSAIHPDTLRNNQTLIAMLTQKYGPTYNTHLNTWRALLEKSYDILIHKDKRKEYDYILKKEKEGKALNPKLIFESEQQFRKGLELINNGRLHDAYPFIKTAYNTNKGETQITGYYHYLEYYCEQKESAFAALKHLYEQHPNNATLPLLLGKIALHKNEWHASKQFFKQCLESTKKQNIIKEAKNHLFAIQSRLKQNEKQNAKTASVDKSIGSQLKNKITGLFK